MPYRYQNIVKSKVNNVGKQYFINVIYPDIPVSETDLYMITVLGDRLDLMANDIYGDPNLWWIIASANNLSGDSLVPPIGGQIRVPVDIQPIINKFNSINTIR